MAETSVELNTGFETSQAGLSPMSKIALNTVTPAGMPSEGVEGALKRNVLEPDQFPRVDLSITNPLNEFASSNPKNQDRAQK
jgi:hypothetical protein